MAISDFLYESIPLSAQTLTWIVNNNYGTEQEEDSELLICDNVLMIM